MSSVELIITPNPDAPPELQDFGKKYWKNDYDDRKNTVTWLHGTNNTDFQQWSGKSYIAAGAGVRACLPGYTCRICGQELALSSRSNLVQALKGKEIMCRDCDDNFKKRVALIFTPENQARQERYREEREKRREQVKLKELEREREQQMRDDHYQAFTALYPVDSGNDPMDVIQRSSLRAQIGTLAAVDLASRLDGIIRFTNQDRPFTPDEKLTQDLIEEAVRAGLLCLAPSTPLEAFRWETNDHTQIRNLIQINHAHFTVPGQDSSAARLEAFSSALLEHLTTTTLSTEECSDLHDLIQHLMSLEATSFFLHCLDRHKLLIPTDQYILELRVSLKQVTRKAPLGSLYRIVWSASRSAASYVQRNPFRQYGEHAANHGVDKAIEYMGRVLNGSPDFDKAFTENRTAPLSRVTKIIFEKLLELPPMTATPTEISTALLQRTKTAPKTCCVVNIPSHQECLTWLEENTSWSPEALQEVLKGLQESAPDTCSPSCVKTHIPTIATHTLEFLHQITTAGSKRSANLIALQAILLSNGIGSYGNEGDIALTEIVTRLRSQ